MFLHSSEYYEIKLEAYLFMNGYCMLFCHTLSRTVTFFSENCFVSRKNAALTHSGNSRVAAKYNVRGRGGVLPKGGNHNPRL